MMIETDQDLDTAVAELDRLLDAFAVRTLTPREQRRMDELSEVIEEYERRTHVLNRVLYRQERPVGVATRIFVRLRGFLNRLRERC